MLLVVRFEKQLKRKSLTGGPRPAEAARAVHKGLRQAPGEGSWVDQPHEGP